MSLPNPINVTYVSPSVEDTFPFQYIVKDTDNIINIDTTNGAVEVILRNIRNSGILQYQPLLSINDGGNNATTNNITIYPSGGDIINDSTSFVINTNGGNSVLTISNINQWLTTSSQASGSGGGGLDGLNYTYVYGNGEDVIENGKQLLNGYVDAISKVVIDNPTIDYGALEIVSQDENYFISEPINTELLEPYFSNGQLRLNIEFELVLDNIVYTAFLQQGDGIYEIYGYPDGSSVIGIYSSAIIEAFYLQVLRSTLIVGAGHYQLSESLILNNDYVDIVSLTGNADVFINVGYNSYGVPITIATMDIFVKGINTGIQPIGIEASSPNNILENCVGGENSYTGTPLTLDGKFINCIGGNTSFAGYGQDCIGTFINCVGGTSSFGSTYLSSALGTFINCSGGSGSFGSVFASGFFENCTAEYYAFATAIDGEADGTFINCRTNYGGFASSTNGIASGDFYNCNGGYSSFGAGTNGIASGDFYNCIGTYISFGWNASGNFYNCIGDTEAFGFGANAEASGNFINCIASNTSFGGGVGGTLTGILSFCKLTDGVFPTVSGGGKTRYCLDGNNATNNQG